MSHFKGHFEGAKTFLTPEIVPSAARDNLGGSGRAARVRYPDDAVQSEKKYWDVMYTLRPSTSS
jgi:hypothetical protein